MPLPTNYSRPTLPYDPQQSLPNDRRFGLLTTLQQPPTAEMFDAEFNAVLDKINTLAEAINGVVVGAIPGSDILQNANRVLVTDGKGNLSFVMVGSDNLSPSSITTALLQDQAVTQQKIGDGAVGTGQLADNAITFAKIADGSVGSAKIANGSVQLPKMRSTGHSCFIIGDDADYAYKELPAAPNYTIPTRIPNETKPSMQLLSVVWNNSADNVCLGTKLKDASTLMSKLRSSAKKCLVMGTEGSHFYTEKVADNESQPWYVFCNNPNADSIALNSLVDIWQNTPYTFTGSKLTNNSVPVTKIQNSQQVAPFCMGYIAANGSAQKSMNLGSITRTGTGYYLVRFNTQANDKNYSVQITADNVQNYAVTGMVVGRTVNGFDVKMVLYVGQAVDANFSFLVYAF